jgi:GT2 family glycosyltransferase
MKDYAAIVIAYGQEHLTNAVLFDLSKEEDIVDVYVFDNKGDYVAPEYSNAMVIKTGNTESLRWCRGTNRAYLEADHHKITQDHRSYAGWFFLNNDIRLSPHFCKNLIKAEAMFGLGTVAPIYDDVWDQQKGDYRGPAANFKGEDLLREVNFFDGAGWYATEEFLCDIGDSLGPVLDEVHFGKFGWGAIEDYCIRARKYGHKAWVTGAAYMNHFRGATYKAEPETEYEKNASIEYNEGMQEKYGPEWYKLLEL